MKALLPSYRLEPFGPSNTLHASRSPLPAQGEGEGEGLSEATRAGIFETPHLGPLPLSKGRGEKKQLLSSENLGSQNVGRDDRGFRI